MPASEYMTPSEFSEDEFAEWEAALQAQRAAEHQLHAAFGTASPEELERLLQRVRTLRTRADLMLADAVHLKCSYRNTQAAALEADRPAAAPAVWRSSGSR